MKYRARVTNIMAKRPAVLAAYQILKDMHDWYAEVDDLDVADDLEDLNYHLS